MNNRFILLGFGLLPLAALAQTGAIQDFTRQDYEIAREAVARGEILPLATVINKVQKAHPGRVIEVELELGVDGVEYELEIATTDGRILDIDVNAVTGEIVSVDEDD